MTRAFVAIGSNLDGPRDQVLRAIEALAALPETRLVAASSLYVSAPFGVVEQPDFVNAVAALDTDLDVTELFRDLQEIEHQQGRTRSVRWGPRVIDLDLLIFGDEIVDEPDLQVPHPRIAERNFVLLPLREVAPDLTIPGLGNVAGLTVDRHEPRIARIDPTRSGGDS